MKTTVPRTTPVPRGAHAPRQLGVAILDALGLEAPGPLCQDCAAGERPKAS